MKFYTAKDLRTDTKNIWNDLSIGDEVVITNNGRPSALILDVSDDNLEETLKAIRQLRVLNALSNAQQNSVRKGLDKMTEEEIEAEIATAREELGA